jgi:hypothetical protein
MCAAGTGCRSLGSIAQVSSCRRSRVVRAARGRRLPSWKTCDMLPERRAEAGTRFRIGELHLRQGFTTDTLLPLRLT